MRFLVSLLALTILLLGPAGAEGLGETRRAIDEAQLMLRNADNDAGHRILWEIFLNGEASGATVLEIAEAAEMLVSSLGTESATESIHLLTWAADAGYPPAMRRLGSRILHERQTTAPGDLMAVLMRYPRIYSVEDAIALIRAAADQGDPRALRSLARFYEHGSHGFLQDPYYADELRSAAVNNLVAMGRAAGDHHMLIDAARAISTSDEISTSERHELLIAEAIEMGNAQPGGMDMDAASELSYYYSMLGVRGAEGTSADQYRWLLRAAYRTPERLNDHYLGRLGEFFLGRRNHAFGRYDAPVDAVAAHAIHNYLAASSSSSLYAERRDDMARVMSEEEVREALSLARTCQERGFEACLDAIDSRFSGTSG